MHRQKFFVAAGLHYAFTRVVYHYCALFGLLVCVAADVDQCFYDIVKRMVVVIVDYQFATAVVQQIQVLFFFFFVLAVVFHNLSIG